MALQTRSIRLLAHLTQHCLVQVFHAGTVRNGDSNIAAVGGRVLGVSATGKDVLEAQQNAYKVFGETLPTVLYCTSMRAVFAGGLVHNRVILLGQ